MAANLPTAYDIAKAAGVIGCVDGGPKDRSTNPQHMDGFVPLTHLELEAQAAAIGSLKVPDALQTTRRCVNVDQ